MKKYFCNKILLFVVYTNVTSSFVVGPPTLSPSMGSLSQYNTTIQPCHLFGKPPYYADV